MMLCKLSLVLSVVSSVSAFAPQTLQTSTPSKVSLLSAIVEGAEEQFERRSFLAKSVGMTLALSSLIGVPSASLAASADYTAVAADISNLVKASPDIGPTFVRLAWHSSGTYDKMSKDGGSGKGTTRFKEELAHGANAGLAKTVVAMMEPLKEKYGENLSYADLYTLGGGMSV
jgi:cytochrome c peroxidase